MVLKIEDLSFVRRNFTLSIPFLSIRPRERVVVLGHNGSGKSTFLSVCLGFEKIQKGSSHQISIFGESPKGGIKKILPLLSFVPQNPDDGIFCSTVREDLFFAVRNFHLMGTETEEDILAKILQKVPIAHLLDRPPYELSYGEKKLTLLGCAFATEPKLLIMDEPFTMLDRRQKNHLETIIRSYEGTLIIASHEYERICKLCDRAIVLQNGSLKYDGPTKTLVEDQKLVESLGL
jgi:cobalt/nickel transport system ATP-binding protein